MCSSYVTSLHVIEFHTVEAYSCLRLTGVKYNINKLSRLEKESVMVRVTYSILTDLEKT